MRSVPYVRRLSRRAFITGVRGQGGSYRTDRRLRSCYESHEIVRRKSVAARPRVNHLLQPEQTAASGFFLHCGDVTDGLRLRDPLDESMTEEMYNLAAPFGARVSRPDLRPPGPRL